MPHFEKGQMIKKPLPGQEYWISLHSPSVNSLPCFHSAAPGTFVATVVVNRNFHARFRQLNGVRQAELHVTDVQPTLYPLALVISLNGKYAARLSVNIISMVKVFG